MRLSSTALLSVLALAGQGTTTLPVSRTSSLANAIQAIRPDLTNTFHVRDLTIDRGGVKLYLTDGILSFLTPIEGRIPGLLFTTDKTESGDAEVLFLPPSRSERQSLAAYTGSPNLSEHARFTLLFFADNTAAELRSQMAATDAQPVGPESADILQPYQPLIENLARAVELRLLQALLDHHEAAHGFFVAVVAGRQMEPFAVYYDPDALEPVTVGRAAAATSPAPAAFTIWSTYRPLRAGPPKAPANRFSNYVLDTSIGEDLSLESEARFDYATDGSEGSVLRFDLSDKLQVIKATMDGNAAEIFQQPILQQSEARVGGAFLLISPSVIGPGKHRIVIRYRGLVVRQTPEGSFFVDERTTWYPYSLSLLTVFDLTFHCPEHFALAATGEPVDEHVRAGLRTVHRRAESERPYAGFNLGNFERGEFKGRPPYRVQVYAEASYRDQLPRVARQAENILDFYTTLWGVVPNHTIAITPVPAAFGQGFPGLVFLSRPAYLPAELRPITLRSEQLDHFFSDILLPHEIAHQWWGNVVNAASYRSAWLVEAFAHYAALRYVARRDGAYRERELLDEFRRDLTPQVESVGPLDWGARLLSTQHPQAWQPIVYEKGAWVLRMLEERLGNSAFTRMETSLLTEHASRPVTNDDIRELASRLVPRDSIKGAADPDLKQFFSTWVENTGVPRLRLRREGRDWTLNINAVDDQFTVDVPLTCRDLQGKTVLYNVRATAGDNLLPRESRAFSACALPSPERFLQAQ